LFGSAGAQAQALKFGSSTATSDFGFGPSVVWELRQYSKQCIISGKFEFWMRHPKLKWTDFLFK